MTKTGYLLKELTDGVLTLTFNRPESLNAFLPETLTALADAVESAKSEGAKVIILQGAGRAFSAGVDLKVLQGETPVAGKIGTKMDGPGVRAATALRNSPVPVIAKVHGACFTGALELALSCDFIYALSSTKFGDTHAKFGLRPTWGMAQLLARAVGPARAKELSFTARTFSGAQAFHYGMINAVFDEASEMDAAIDDTAKKIAANSAGAVSAYKDLYHLAGEHRPFEEAVPEALSRHYPEITDAAERLAGFG